jgi:hypothetical protein
MSPQKTENTETPSHSQLSERGATIVFVEVHIDQEGPTENWITKAWSRWTMEELTCCPKSVAIAKELVRLNGCDLDARTMMEEVNKRMEKARTEEETSASMSSQRWGRVDAYSTKAPKSELRDLPEVDLGSLAGSTCG